MTLEDSASTVIAIAAMALGHEDPFALTSDDLAEIRDYLIAHKSQIRALFKGDADFLNLYRTGEIVAGFGYHDYRAAMEREGIPVEFVPGRGSLAWILRCVAVRADRERRRRVRGDELLRVADAADVLRGVLHLHRVGSTHDRSSSIPSSSIELGLDDPAQLDSAIALQLPENYDEWLAVFRDFKAA